LTTACFDPRILIMIVKISPFDRLVAELTNDERKELLKKIQASVNISNTPVFSFQNDPDKKTDIDEEYEKLSLFTRIVLWIKTLITGRDKKELTADMLFLQLKKKIERNYPGIADFKQEIFLSGMLNELKRLLEASEFFRPFVLRALGKYREDFFAFLADEELNRIHLKIEEAINPQSAQRDMGAFNSGSIKEEIERRFKEVLDSIEEDDKRRVYKKAIILQSIYNFCLFKLEDIINKFKKPAGSAAYIAHFNEVKEYIPALLGYIYTFNTPPDTKLLQVLFFFSYQERINDEYLFEEDLKTALTRSEEMLNSIRGFNRAVPLLELTRYLLRDLNYKPVRMSGGEDWLLHFTNFWKKRLNHRYRLFDFAEKRKELLDVISDFFRSGKFELASYFTANRIIKEGKFYFAYPVAVGFLESFYKHYFLREINSPLKILLLNGEFYKDENRKEFTNAYNSFFNLKINLDSLENNLSETGKYGKELVKIDAENIKPRLKEKQIQIIVERAENDAESIVEGAILNLRGIIRVLDGILYGEVGGEYDTLSNYGEIGGRKNKSYINSLRAVSRLMDRCVVLLSKIYTFEKSKPDYIIDLI